MPSDDIVARLRDCDGGYGFRGIVREAADEIERLRAERDEARREVLESLHPDVRESHAAARGWVFSDCFKEATDDR